MRVHHEGPYELSDIEVLGTEAVTVRLHGTLAQLADKLKIASFAGTVSSTPQHGYAIVIGEQRDDPNVDR